MAAIDLKSLRRAFGPFVAVNDIDLTIEDGKFVVLLGPSGCGKTTTLRMIAGLEMPTSGQILLDRADVTYVRPRERDIAMVFQLFALYPHMSVRENLAFPLRNERLKRAEIDRRIQEATALLRIDHLLGSRIGGLSGGDRQRVALGRAIVRQPKAFLMDEPLGTLDAEFRELMCIELRKLHNRLRTTTVFVTHDQDEAMSLADHIVVMKDGEIQQSDTPEGIYNFPANMFVANFIGRPPMNFLAIDGPVEAGVAHVQVAGQALGIPIPRTGAARAKIGIRPSQCHISDTGALAGEVVATEFFGSHQIATLVTAAGPVKVEAGRTAKLTPGETLRLSLDTGRIVLFDADTEKLLPSDTSLARTAGGYHG
ncbi:ABC transporter ATP-binding protein [Elstera sp.]|jgi:multiple sugar transport system ATP-binding protein|uniref:ABC transporter ATP-binding protein n=1 Tax=Elstera sp. TaxID=1916664 RepID=UPI0037C15434